MARRFLPGVGYIVEPATSGRFYIPGIGYLKVSTASAPPGASYRALVLVNGRLSEVIAAGVGHRPVVLVNGRLQERVGAEGTPVVLIGGVLHTLPVGGTLII